MPGDLVRATGLDAEAFAERKAAWKTAQPQPWPAERGEDGSITGLTPEGQRFRLIPEGHPEYEPAMAEFHKLAPGEATPAPEEPVTLAPPTVSEAHSAGRDDGREAEAHGAALAAAKPVRHPRKAGTNREIP